MLGRWYENTASGSAIICIKFLTPFFQGGKNSVQLHFLDSSYVPYIAQKQSRLKAILRRKVDKK